MKTGEHLSADQITGYQDRTLVPAEQLAVDGHLAVCSECRDELFRRSGAGAQLSGLRSRFSQHLSYDEVAACAAARGAVGSLQHVEQCAACAEEIEDLKRFQAEVAATPRAPVEMPVHRANWTYPVSIAAAVAVIVGMAWWSARQQRAPVAPPVVARQEPPKPVEPVLTATQRDAVQLALTAHRIERPAVLKQLIGKQGVLLGDPKAPETFDLVAPIGTVVTADRPVFRWHAVKDAKQYRVSVFDEEFRKVAESPALTASEWTPSHELPRGRLFIWQVTATVGNELVRAPIPPAPEARFQIVGAPAAAEIEKARAEHPNNHLLLAVLLGKAGALDEAASELDALAATDPATAGALRGSVAK